MPRAPEPMPRIHPLFALGVLVALGVGTARADDGPAPATAKAAPAPASQTAASPPATPAPARDQLRPVVCKAGDPLPDGQPIPIASGSFAVVRFPGKISASATNRGVIDAANGGDSLAIKPAANARPGDQTSVKIEAPGFAPATLDFRVVDQLGGNPGLWLMLADSTIKDNDVERQAEREAERDVTQREAMVHWVHDDAFMDVRLDKQGCEGEPIAICGEVWSRSRDRGVLRFAIENHTSQELDAESLRVSVTDERGRKDRAGLQHVTDSHDRPVSVIAPGARVKVSVEVDDPDTLGRKLRVVLNGSVPVFPADRYFRVVPSASEWAANERRKERIEREAKRVSLAVVGSFGAIWLPSGADGREELEPATLTGLGVRYTKGITPLIAFETEVGGATSGTAEYGTVTIDGTQGELTRSAKLGRLSLGGMLRFGDRVVPHARLGVGLQVVSQDVSMVTAGGEMAGPESGVEVAGGVYGGAGVDVKLGSNLVAGLGFAFTAAQHNQQILDVGLNLAYRWDPAQ